MQKRGCLGDERQSIPSSSSTALPAVTSQQIAQSSAERDRLVGSALQLAGHREIPGDALGLPHPPWMQAAFFADNPSMNAASGGTNEWPLAGTDTAPFRHQVGPATAMRIPSAKPNHRSAAPYRAANSLTASAETRQQGPPASQPPFPIYPEDPALWHVLQMRSQGVPGKLQATQSDVAAGPPADLWQRHRDLDSRPSWPSSANQPHPPSWHSLDAALPLHTSSIGTSPPVLTPSIDAQDAIQLLQRSMAQPQQHHVSQPQLQQSAPHQGGLAGMGTSEDRHFAAQSQLQSIVNQHSQLQSNVNQHTGLAVATTSADSHHATRSQLQREITQHAGPAASSTPEDCLEIRSSVSQAQSWPAWFQQAYRQQHSEPVGPFAGTKAASTGLSPDLLAARISDPAAVSQSTESPWDRLEADLLPASAAQPAEQHGHGPVSPSTDLPGLGDEGSSPDEPMESEETVAAGKSSRESPSRPVTSGSNEGPAAALHGPRRVSRTVQPDRHECFTWTFHPHQVVTMPCESQ